MAVLPLPRQQRRKLRRDLVERGRKSLERGLPRPTGNDDALGIVLALVEGLEDGRIAERASRLADQAETLLDRTMSREIKGLAYACRKGCGWCCWQRVTCTAPEVFRVAQWMRANAAREGVPTLDMIRRAEEAEASGTVVSLPGAAGIGATRRPCTLLLDDACSVHPGRPIPCRAVLSMSAEACRDAMLDPSTAGPVPLVVGALDTAEVVRTLMLAAVSAKGLGDAGYDLPQALLLVLPDPTAEARWLAGEDVLAAVDGAPRPPAARAAQQRLVEMARPLLET